MNSEIPIIVLDWGMRLARDQARSSTLDRFIDPDRGLTVVDQQFICSTSHLGQATIVCFRMMQ